MVIYARSCVKRIQIVEKKEYLKKWQIAMRYDKYFISRLYAYKFE